MKTVAQLLMGAVVSGSVLLMGVTLPVESAQAATQTTSSSAKDKSKTASKSQTAKTSGKPARRAKSVASGRKVAAVAAAAVAAPSFGQLYGLHAVNDPLDLKSSVALVMDQDTNEVLLAKNTQAVLPIASITKLMTALLVVEGGQSPACLQREGQQQQQQQQHWRHWQLAW